MKYSNSQLLRFPVIFGSLVGILVVGFYNRETWMGDIDAAKFELYKENEKTGNMLEELKKEHKKRVELLK